MKKSMTAKLVTVYLKLRFKKRYRGNGEVATKQLLKERAKGEKEYKLPKMHLGCSVIKRNFDGMDTYILNGKSNAPYTIFYIHGGGYVNQPLYFHWRFVKKLIKNTNAKVIFPIYPKAPFHMYDEMYDKMLRLYNEYTDTSDEIVFMGDSAGGGFILSFYEYLLDNDIRVPDKVIAISPWLDLATDNPHLPQIEHSDPILVQEITHVWAKLWAGDNINDYMVSATNFNKPELLKNITLVIGTDEILYPDAIKFFDKIKHNLGCELIVGQNMNHVYPLYPIPEAKKLLKLLVNKIRSN